MLSCGGSLRFRPRRARDGRAPRRKAGEHRRRQRDSGRGRQRCAGQRHARARARLRRYPRGRDRPHRLRRGPHESRRRRGDGRFGARRAHGDRRRRRGDVSRRARRPRQVPCAALPSDRSRWRVRRRGAAGKLYRLTEDELVRAFGICGSQTAGIIEYLADGTWTKRLHPGWSAHAGIIAALLDQSGFTGPESVFEGEHGFYRAFAGDVQPERLDELLASLGRVWELEQLTFKPYPCGSIAQPYMDCALRLRETRAVRPEDFVEIRCRTAEGPVPRLWEPLAAKHAPQNGYAAKFSLPYLLAVILTKGRASLAEFEDNVVQDP